MLTQKHSSPENTRKLQEQLISLSLPIRNLEIIKSNFDFHTYLNKANAFLQSIFECNMSGESAKKLITQILQFWLTQVNRTILFDKILSDKELININPHLIKEFIVNTSKFLVKHKITDQESTNTIEKKLQTMSLLIDSITGLFEATKKIENLLINPNFDINIFLTIDFSNIISILNSFELTDSIENVKNSVTFILQNYYSAIEFFAFHCTTSEIAAHVYPFLEACTDFIQRHPSFFNTELMLQYEIYKITTLSFSPNKLKPAAWRLLALLEKTRDKKLSYKESTHYSFKTINITKHEILIRYYASLATMEFDNNCWRNAEFYLEKAQHTFEKSDNLFSEINDPPPLRTSFVNALKHTISFLIKEHDDAQIIKYQKSLLEQYEKQITHYNTKLETAHTFLIPMLKAQKNPDACQTLKLQNPNFDIMISVGINHWTTQAKLSEKNINITTQEIEQLKSSIQLYYNLQTQSLLEKYNIPPTVATNQRSDDPTIFEVKLLFQERKKARSFSNNLRKHHIGHTLASLNNEITINCNNLEFQSLEEALDDFVTTLGNIIHRQHSKTSLSKQKDKTETISPESEDTPTYQLLMAFKPPSQPKKKNRNKKTKPHPNGNLLPPSYHTQTPELRVTFQNSVIFPSDEESPFFCTFLKSKFFPDQNYIGLLNKKLSEKISDPQWDKFVSIFKEGKIVSPINSSGIVFCKKQNYPAKIKHKDAAKHGRIYGSFADNKATLFRKNLGDNSETQSEINVIIFEKYKTKNR